MSTIRPRLRVVPGGAAAESAPAPLLDDTRLLAAVRAGDPTAAAALYRRARPVVERAIRRLLGRPDPEEQDIFQQVMVEIVRSIDRYRGECPFEAWLRTLAAHVVYKNLRHRRVEQKLIAQAPVPEAAGTDQPARRALVRSTIGRVRSHLGALDPDRAWAFLLHDVHGYELREMAEIMGTSVAAAQSRLVRGRKELHERIAADPELATELTDRGGGET